MLAPAWGMDGGVCGAAGSGIAKKNSSRQLLARMESSFRGIGWQFYNAVMRIKLAVLLLMMIVTPLRRVRFPHQGHPAAESRGIPRLLSPFRGAGARRSGRLRRRVRLIRKRG